MRLFQEKLGVEKVRFWLSVLVLLLCVSLGLRLGDWVVALLREHAANMSIQAFISQWLQHLLSRLQQNDPELETFLIADIVTVTLILILVCKYLPKRRERRNASADKKPGALNALFLPALLSGVIASAFLPDKVLRLGAAETGLLSAFVVEKLIMVLQDVYVKRNSTDYMFFEVHKKTVLQITTLVGIAFVGFPLWIPDFWGFTLPQILPDSVDLLGYYTALLSLTFISISVMGVLSDRSVVIYWDNVSEGKLIRPVFGSFAAYTYYSIGATLGAGICVALNNSTAFILFGVINIVTIILLTFTMVDVYYDREGKKQKRVQQLHEDLEDYQWVRTAAELTGEEKEDHLKKVDKLTGKKTNENYTDIEITNKQIGHRGYEEKMMLLCQYISQAYDEHDLAFLREVYDLYVNNLHCFYSPNGKRVISRLYADCNAETWPLMTRSIRDLLDKMEKTPIRDQDPLADCFLNPGHHWNQDEQLWLALTDSDYLQQWLQKSDNDPFDAQELQDFLHLVARRLVLLYNDAVTHHNMDPNKASNPCSYLTVISQGAQLKILPEKGRRTSRKQVLTVFHSNFNPLIIDSTFLARLAPLITIMLRNLNKDAITVLKNYLHNFPLLGALTKYLPSLGLNDEAQALWQQHFPAPWIVKPQKRKRHWQDKGPYRKLRKR